MFAKDRRYYKRAGDSTYVMEHYDIEDAFRRAVTPSLAERKKPLASQKRWHSITEPMVAVNTASGAV